MMNGCRILPVFLIVQVVALHSFLRVNRTAASIIPGSYQASGPFDSLDGSVSKLREVLALHFFQQREKEQLSTNLNAIQRNSSFLREISRQVQQSPIPEEYARSLAMDAELLSRIANESPGTATLRAKAILVTREVAGDLSIKAEFVRSARSPGLRSVQVLIRTKNDKGEIGGYEVWYVPRGWADEESAWSRFYRLSSPTWMDLAPGNYIFWLQKADVRTKKTPVSVGVDGKSKIEIDLPTL
jgi:hypothetical protein